MKNILNCTPNSEIDIKENTIYLESPYVAYGIYSAWNWAGDSPTVDYLANYIEAESHAVYAMNIYGSEGLIDGNIIIANGDYTMGICSMMMDDVAVITNNNIDKVKFKRGK